MNQSTQSVTSVNASPATSPATQDTTSPATSPATTAEQLPTAPEPVPPYSVEQANGTLKAFGKQCRTATDHNYRAAELAAQYVHEFLGAAPGKSTRSVAVERLAAEWMLWDEESMSVPQVKAMTTLRARVNVLLRVNAVVQLLGDGRGADKGNGTANGRGKGKAKEQPLPWGTLREFSPLVERDADEYGERWHVQPHVATKAAALVTEVATSGMARADVVKAVEVLVQEEQAARIAEAKRQADADKAAADEARAAELAARKQAAEAKQTADKAAVLAAEPDATPEAVDAAQVALAELRDKQAAAKVATETAALAKAKTAQAERDAADAEKKQAALDAKQAAKERKAADKANGATPQAPLTPTASQGQNLLATAKHGTTKDVAEMALELIVGSEAPDDVFQTLLDALDSHKQLCKASHRAVKAALLSLTNSTRTVSPVAAATALTAKDAAQVNGQVVAA